MTFVATGILQPLDDLLSRILRVLRQPQQCVNVISTSITRVLLKHLLKLTL